MSWMRQQGNEDGGYANGQSSRDTSADERSRSRGGYGGFAQQQDQGARRVGQPTHLERRQANRRSQDRPWDSSRSRSRARFGSVGDGKQVEEVLRYINQQWSFMTSDSCVPVKVALQLMDSSSLGLADQHDQFQQTHAQLQAALKSIVNEHHQGFNSSIGTFHQIKGSIQASQHRVRGLKQSLFEAKSNLGTSRPELKAFATSSQDYDQMLHMLGDIQELQTMPEKIEAQISEKRFLGAVETLQDALRLMRRPELEEIGALSDLKVYLSNQEHSVTDILIEELHSHLYLKSPYCEDRWKQYAGRTGDPSNAVFDPERRQLSRFLESLDTTQPMIEDTSHNPEADSFSYIQLLLEALDRMSRLDMAVDAIENRLPVELFRVVEKCYNDIEQNHPSVTRSASKPGQTILDTMADDKGRKEVLDDMLSSLFARFEAIAEGHRVLHDVVSGILQRQGVREPALLRSFNELWKLYQSEIRSLLHDHLSSSGNVGQRIRQDNDASANIFRPHARDKTRRMFKLTDTDSKSTSLMTEREDLEYIFKASVPGLVSTNAQAPNQSSENLATTDRSATGHKLLVQPSVFNMGILLPPSLAFLARLKDVVPQNSNVVLSTLTSFLDDFLVNVFLPQMEETLQDRCVAASVQLDSFQSDPKWTFRTTKPVFKSTMQLIDLMSAFCRMLDSLPPDQSFSQLIIAQLRNYYSRCNEFYRTLVTMPQLDTSAPRALRKAATFAEHGDYFHLLRSLFDSTGTQGEELSHQETALLLASAKSQPLQDAELISDPKAISQLCTLYTSTRWFTARITALRHIDPKATDISTSLSRHQQRRWTSLDSALADDQPYLPLSRESAIDFDAVCTSFTELSSLILRTLHLELRLQTLHGIGRALETTYLLRQPYNDPDPSILSLNRTLLAFDEDLSSHLPLQQYKLCTAYLSTLADTALINDAATVPAMDEHGNARMQLNILVLQQNLKEMDKSASLALAARFWELWEEGPESVVEACKAGLDKRDARELIRLCYSSPDGPGSKQGQRSMEDVLGELGKL